MQLCESSQSGKLEVGAASFQPKLHYIFDEEPNLPSARVYIVSASPFATAHLILLWKSAHQAARQDLLPDCLLPAEHR